LTNLSELWPHITRNVIEKLASKVPSFPLGSAIEISKPVVSTLKNLHFCGGRCLHLGGRLVGKLTGNPSSII
jgi:hypothetical protein